MRLGVFGGTFDPPHIGHLIVAQDACAALRLDRLLFVPSAQPPHKRERTVTRPDLRLAMLRVAVEGDERFSVSEIELHRSGPSYTIDTLRALRAREPEAELLLLIGADQLGEFHTWREPAEIARAAQLVVLTRAGVPLAEPHLDVPYRTVSVTRIELSATEIRRRVASGRPIRYLVPAGVEALIRREGLYGPGGENVTAGAG